MSCVEQQGDSSSPKPCVRASAVLSETTIDDSIDASTRRYAELHRSSTVLTPSWEKVPPPTTRMLAFNAALGSALRQIQKHPSEYSVLMHVKPPQPDRDIRRSPRSPCHRDG